MTAVLPWFAGLLDDENQPGVLIPKQRRPLQVMPAQCDNPSCRPCNGTGVRL